MRNACRVRRIWIPSAGHPKVSETTSLSLPDGRAGLDRPALLHAIGQEKRPILLDAEIGFVSRFESFCGRNPLCFHRIAATIGFVLDRLDFERPKLALMGPCPAQTEYLIIPDPNTPSPNGRAIIVDADNP